MKKWKSLKGWALGFVIIASGLILFFNLWARSLENHDYLRYAEVAREMIQSGEWIIPHYNGAIFIDKPPLLFWLIAIPSSLYGSVTPMISRLPSALSAWMGVIIIFLWARRVYGTTASGLIASGVLLSSYQYFFQGRIAKTDMVLCLFILLTLYFFYLGYRANERKHFFFYGLSFFFMGLGVLTKGPFGLFISFLVIAVFLFKERKIRMMISKEFLFGYLILLLTTLPWIFLFIYRVGLDQTITLVKENQILTRHAPIYFYFIEIWPQFSPWSILLPFLFVYFWRQRGKVWHSEESFFLIWFVVIFLLLTLFQYRASRYLLPVLPAFALMIGGMWKKRMTFFFVPFLLFILIWHLVEFNWIKEDVSHSPGMVLVEKLKPVIKGSTLFGYGLDVSTVEEINFYLHRVIPILKDGKNLSTPILSQGERWVLMPKEVYEEVQGQIKDSIRFVQKFRYKKGELVLVTMKQWTSERI